MEFGCATFNLGPKESSQTRNVWVWISIPTTTRRGPNNVVLVLFYLVGLGFNNNNNNT